MMRLTLLGASLLALAACGGGGSSGPYGGPEAATYDAAGDRYFVSNVGAFDNQEDGFLMTVSGEGVPQPLRWAPQDGQTPLGKPLGIAIHDGVVYVANTPTVRRYTLATGMQQDPIEIPNAVTLNDVAVATDGTLYVTDTGGEEASTWALYRVTPAGDVSTIASGEALQRPNGVDVGPDGRIYLAVMASPAVVVLDTSGAVVETITAPHGGNDGIVVLEDGIILSSVVDGKVSFIAEDGTSRLLTDELPGAASIGYDPTRRRIAVPRIAANTVDFIDLD